MSDKDLRSKITSPHPGEILKDILLSRSMSQRDLAAAIGKTTPVVNDILSRKRDINVEIAVLLEAYFEQPSAKDWLALQSAFDIELARLTQKVREQERLICDWKSLDDKLNLRIIKKRAGLGSSIQNDLNYICSLYGQSSVEGLKEQLALTQRRACFKRSEAHTLDSRNLNTWLLLTRITNDKLQTPPSAFAIRRISELINQLNEVFYLNEHTLERVSEVLHRFGVKFFVEKKLEKMPVDGYSFWEGENPTIVVTTRISWLDNLAFTIFHELGHIVKHLINDKHRDFLDNTESSESRSTSKEEEEANVFASECIWKKVDWKKIFNAIKMPFSASPILKKISARYQINEGIVVGQYQHFCSSELHLPSAYTIATKMKQKIK